MTIDLEDAKRRGNLHARVGDHIGVVVLELCDEVARLRSTIAQMADTAVRAEEPLIRERDEAMKAAQRYKQERDEARSSGLHAHIAHLQAKLDVAERDRLELLAWQEKVCAIIQPAETHDEWGADVADIIRGREEQRRAALVVVEAARQIHNRNVTGFRVSTGIIDALAAYDAVASGGAGEANSGE